MDNKIRFFTLNLNVNDLCESISFYKELSFHVDKISENSDYLFAIMSLPDSDFKICLRQFFQKKDKNLNKVSLGLIADDNSVSFENIRKNLKLHRIRHCNFSPYEIYSSGICQVAIFKDSNGNEIEFTNELNPTFDYDQHLGY